MGGIDYSSLVQKHMSSFYSSTNVTTTSSGYSAPSTANQIADALLGIGSMAAMMAIASKAQGGNAAVTQMQQAGLQSGSVIQAYVQADADLDGVKRKMATALTDLDALKQEKTNAENAADKINEIDGTNGELAQLDKEAGVDSDINKQMVESYNKLSKAYSSAMTNYQQYNQLKELNISHLNIASEISLHVGMT